MQFNTKQMRAIELNIEQQERFAAYKDQRLDTPVDMLAKEFFTQGFEAYQLVRISALLADLPTNFIDQHPQGAKI